MTTATMDETGGSAADTIFSGGVFKDAVGLDDDDMEAVYHLAYNQYEQGQYEEAERTFNVLCFHDHLNQRYWLGLGAARQQLRDFPGAILAYSMVAETGNANPMAPLRAAECYIALGLFEEAASGLEAALEWAANGDRDTVISHVELLFAVLEHMLDADDPAVEGDDR